MLPTVRQAVRGWRMGLWPSFLLVVIVAPVVTAVWESLADLRKNPDRERPPMGDGLGGGPGGC